MSVPAIEVTLEDGTAVRALGQIPRFFAQDGRDFVEISYIGSKDTIVHKVTPKHMAQFRSEWLAYKDGAPLEKRQGTPLTDVEGLAELRADQFIGQQVHNAEELAALSDGQCSSLGHGTLTLRNAARKLLMVRQATDAERRMSAVSKAAGTITTDAPQPSNLAKVESGIENLTQQMTQLVQLLTAQAMAPEKRGPGRPPKEKTED